MVLQVTKEEFEASYAVNSGLLVGQLGLLGLEAVPCACGAPGCHGLKMAFEYQGTPIPGFLG